MSDIDREIAQKTQEKFEFYVISLVFTLLALSIQTSKFGSSNIADASELSGWVSLLVSGLAGLWRMQFVPIVVSLVRPQTAQTADLRPPDRPVLQPLVFLNTGRICQMNPIAVLQQQVHQPVPVEG